MFSTLYIMWYINVQPHVTRERKYLEIFNEIMIIMCTYHMVLFSQFNGSPELHFLLGYTYVGVIALVIVVNIGLLLFKSVTKARRLSALKQLRINYLKAKK